MMTNLLRVRFLVVVALVGLVGFFPQQTLATTTVAIEPFETQLVAQNFNVSSSGQFRFVLGITNPTARAALEQDLFSTLHVEVFAPATSREQVRQIVAGSELSNPIAFTDVTVNQLSRNDSGDFTAYLSTTANTRSLRLTKDGVYPIRLSFVQAKNTVSGVMTFVNFYNTATRVARLPVALVAALPFIPSLLPDGTTTIAETLRTQLLKLCTVLESSTARISVQLAPEVLDGLARSSDPRDIALLTRLQTAFATNDILLNTFVPIDPSIAQQAHRGAGFEKQLTRGETVIAVRNGGKKVLHNVWFSTIPIDDDGMLLLQNSGVRSVVFTPKAAEKIGALDNYAKAYKAARSMGINIVDPVYAQEISGAPYKPVPTAYAIAAELLAQGQEILDSGGILSTRFVVISTTTGVLADAAVLTPLAIAIDRAPQLRLRGLSSLPPVAPDATVVQLPISKQADLVSRGATLDTLTNEIASTATMLPADAPQHAAWATSLLVTAADTLTADEFGLYVKGLRSQLRILRTSVNIPDSLSFTLGGRKSDLRLQLRNDATVDLKVLVAISSTKLQFPSTGATNNREVTIPAQSTIDLVVPVVARASGRFPIDIVISTPDGMTQVGKKVRLTARVAAINGLGQVVTGAAALVLMSWWITHLRSSRRKKSAQKHPAVG